MVWVVGVGSSDGSVGVDSVPTLYVLHLCGVHVLYLWWHWLDSGEGKCLHRGTLGSGACSLDQHPLWGGWHGLGCRTKSH